MTAEADAAVIERFADALWMERGLSANSLAAYQTDLRQLAAWLEEGGKGGLLDAQRAELLDYLVHLHVQGRKSRSAARALSALRQFYRHALREGWMTTDPSADIDGPRLGPRFSDLHR